VFRTDTKKYVKDLTQIWIRLECGTLADWRDRGTKCSHLVQPEAKRTKVTELEMIRLSVKYERDTFMDTSRGVAYTCERVSVRAWLICKQAT